MDNNMIKILLGRKKILKTLVKYSIIVKEQNDIILKGGVL